MSKKPILKICIFGKQGVGKTSIIQAFLKEMEEKTGTIVEKKEISDKVGVNFYKVENFKVKGRYVNLQLWNFVGDDEYKFLLKKYVKGAAGGIFVYDITDRTSVENIGEWLAEFRKGKRNNENIPILMVGNKVDQEEKRKITKKEASNLMYYRMYSHVECSAENGKNIEEIFKLITSKILETSIFDSLREVFETELTFKILIQLKAHGELSSSELVNKLKVSKATVSRNTRKLVNLDLINSYEKEDEIQPGKIKRKYYALNEKLGDSSKEIIFPSTVSDLEAFWEDIYDLYRNKSFVFKTLNYISNALLHGIETPKFMLNRIDLALTGSNNKGHKFLAEQLDFWVEIIKKNSFDYHFLNEKQFSQVQSLKKEFNSKIENILKDDDDTEKRYFHANLTYPILDFVDYWDSIGDYLLQQKFGRRISKIFLNK